MKKAVRMAAVFLLLALALTACGGKSGVSVHVAPPEQRETVFGAFTTVDLAGNAVDDTVFAGQSLTMVNIWGTTCAGCIKEMPELAELNRAYDDFAVIGVAADITNRRGEVKDALYADALSIVDATGADYVHLVPCGDMIENKLITCQTLPETVFVDSQGRQVGESYLGARTKAEWAQIIDALREAMG